MGRPRVNGANLSREIGNRITLFGMITGVSSNQTNIELLTPDKIKVNVALPEPFTGLAEGGIEVSGVVQSKTTMSADNYIYLKPLELRQFNPKHYNAFLLMLNTIVGQDETIQAAFEIV